MALSFPRRSEALPPPDPRRRGCCYASRVVVRTCVQVKLLKHLRSEFIVELLDAYDEEEAPPSIVLEGGALSLAEYLGQSQLTNIERRLVLERLCLAIDFVHSKNLVLVDLKPQNVVIFGAPAGTAPPPPGPTLCHPSQPAGWHPTTDGAPPMVHSWSTHGLASRRSG